jgi:hypothetical protein
MYVHVCVCVCVGVLIVSGGVPSRSSTDRTPTETPSSRGTKRQVSDNNDGVRSEFDVMHREYQDRAVK